MEHLAYEREAKRLVLNRSRRRRGLQDEVCEAEAIGLKWFVLVMSEFLAENDT